MSITSTGPECVLAELVRLQRDEDPTTRSVGAALAASVFGVLTDEERRWVGEIEALRAELDASPEVVDVALANTRGVVKQAEIGETCRRRSKKEPWGTFLLTLARTLVPERCVELGTCLGISSAYLAAGMKLGGRGHLVTLEGAPALAERSRRNLASLGLRNVDVEAGLFVNTLPAVLERASPVALAFIDGHHQEEPTLAYFDQIARCLAEPAVVVFDDIIWSDGMERAWAAILTHPRVRVAVDLTSVGVCVVGPPSAETTRVYRFPTISAMQPSFEHVTARPEPISTDHAGVSRLHWTLDSKGKPGWLNVSPQSGPEIDIVTDVRHGVPLDDNSVGCIVSMRALQAIRLLDVFGVLVEFRRMLRPGGTLRLGLPDLEHSLAVLQRGDGAGFVVSDRDAQTPTGKFITQVLWYGFAATLFTAEFSEELLYKAGYSQVRRCAFGETESGDDEIVALDDQGAGMFFVEAVK